MKTNKQKCSRLDFNQLTSLKEEEYKIILKKFDCHVSQGLKRKTLQGQKRLSSQNQESNDSSLYESEKN